MNGSPCPPDMAEQCGALLTRSSGMTMRWVDAAHNFSDESHMQFLKTLLWVMLAVAFMLFSFVNWAVTTSESGRVILQIWGGLVVEARLPILLLIAMLIGFLPTLLVYGTRAWSLRRRLESQVTPASNAPPPIRNAPAPPDPTPRSNL